MPHRWRSRTTVPGLPSDHVSRPALLEALDLGEDCLPTAYAGALAWTRALTKAAA